MQTAASSPGRWERKPSSDTLKQLAFEKLTKAIEQGVGAASPDTLADIIGASDLRQALAIAPRDIPPPPPERLAAVQAARAATTRFRADLAEQAGGMYDRAQVAEFLSVTPAAVDKQRQRRQILGVSYGTEVRFPAAQFKDGEIVKGLKKVLEAFGDMNPWGQLQLLTTPLEGFGEKPTPVLDILSKNPSAETLRQITALAASWAA